MSEQADNRVHYAEPVARGCGGSRTKGGAYWEIGFSKNGKPIEHFLICPESEFDTEAFQMSAQGVTLHHDVKTDVWHVLDWIGAMHYPNVTDFIEECRRFGLSRRVELSKGGYKKLTRASRLITIHPAGFIKHPYHYWSARIGMDDDFFRSYKWLNCPKEIDEHLADREEALKRWKAFEEFPMCCGLWYEDAMFAEPIAEDDRRSIREMPAFNYRCASPPDTKMMDHSPAIVAGFPLGRIVVIEDPDGGTHEAKMEKIELGDGMKVELVEE